MEEYKIIELLKAAPNDGLHIILSQYGGIIKAVVTRILGTQNKNEIEECVSDTLLQFWKSIDLFDEKKASSLKAYLCKIARNIAINKKRKFARNLDIFLAFDLAANVDIVDAVIGHMNSSAVTAAINNLPEPDRTIFIRRYYFCMSVKEIAGELGLDCKTVENKLYRRNETHCPLGSVHGSKTYRYKAPTRICSLGWRFAHHRRISAQTARLIHRVSKEMVIQLSPEPNL